MNTNFDIISDFKSFPIVDYVVKPISPETDIAEGYEEHSDYEEKEE